MNRKLVFSAALAAGILPVAAFGQVSPTPPASSAPAAAAPTQAKLAAPTAFPAKIALVAFDQCVLATNEGQRAIFDIQKKYEPKKAQIEQEGSELDALKKQADALPATAQDERASRMRTIDAKDKQLQLDVEKAQSDYQAEFQDAYAKVAQKVNVVLQKYVKDSGYTLLIDYSNQQSAIMWASQEPNGDITEAVVNAYNAATPGITAPPPAAPSATPSAAPRPSTAPRTAPRPAAGPTK